MTSSTPTADHDADDERDAGAGEHARENVAPQLVEAEPVRRRRTIQPTRELLRHRIERRRARVRMSGEQRSTIRTMAAPTLLIADPRIDEPVEQIGDEVHADVGHRDQQDATLHQWIVAEADRLDQQAADARPREDRFGDHRAGEHRHRIAEGRSA